MKYPRGLVVNNGNLFSIYGGNWLTDELAIKVLKEFGYEETDTYKIIVVDEYHKYLIKKH